jgi:uncharacterized protein GlcG (DUF336 family)
MRSIRRLTSIVAAAVVLGGGLVGAIGISGDGIDQDDLVSAAGVTNHVLDIELTPVSNK